MKAKSSLFLHSLSILLCFVSCCKEEVRTVTPPSEFDRVVQSFTTVDTLTFLVGQRDTVFFVKTETSGWNLQPFRAVVQEEGDCSDAGDIITEKTGVVKYEAIEMEEEIAVMYAANTEGAFSVDIAFSREANARDLILEFRFDRSGEDIRYFLGCSGSFGFGFFPERTTGVHRETAYTDILEAEACKVKASISAGLLQFTPESVGYERII